jgi:hypothetical protein
MKKTLLILSMLLVASGSVMARRLEIPAKLGLSVLRQGTTVKLFYKAASANDVNVRIYDTHGTLRFQETIRKVDGFVRPYNFERLPKGDYLIEVTDRTGRSLEKISYREETLPQACLIRLKGDDQKYLITIANQKKATLSVNIFNDEGKLVYHEPDVITGDFSRVYNMKNVSNKFVVEVTDGKGNSVQLSN